MKPDRSDVKPNFWDSAKRSLARRDPVMAAIMRAHPKIFLVRRGEPFMTLARAIVGQQISVKAAQSVWDRVVACVGGEVSPQTILGRERPLLRACGLSDRKTEYIADLAHAQDRRALAAVALGGDLVPVALARPRAGRILK